MEGTRLWVPGVINLMGEELMVVAHRDGVDLSTRVYFHGHQFDAVSWGAGAW